MTSLNARGDIAFQESTSSAGLTKPPTPSYGLSIGDVNGDGWPDIFLNNHALPNTIFVNDGDGTFSDLTTVVDVEQYWAGQPGGYEDTHGGTWIDFDNDGDQDLLIATGDCCDPQFMENIGGELFYRSQEYGFVDDLDRGGRTPIWFDVRNDGVPEVAITTFHATTLLERTGSQFSSIVAETGFGCADTQYGVLVDLNFDDKPDVVCVRRGGSFARAWDYTTVPFKDITGLIPDALGVNDVVLGDYDRNGKNDLFLLTGALRPSEVALLNGNTIEAQFINRERRMTFISDGVLDVKLDWNRTKANFVNIYIGETGYNPVTADFTLDPSDPMVAGIMERPAGETEPAWYIGFDPAEELWTFRMYPGAVFNAVYLQVASDTTITALQSNGQTDRELPQPPVLLSNLPGGMEDRTSAANLDSDIWCVSGVAADFDNDMDTDIYLACRGGVRNVPNILLENDGTGVFTPVGNAGGAAGIVGFAVGQNAGVGDSVASADLNMDGRIDLLVTNGLNIRPFESTGGPTQLFINQSGAGNWLLLDLEGTASTRDAIGAKVSVTAGGVTQVREQNDGLHRWTQNHRRLHFGLADNSVAQIEVRWPAGTTETFDNVDANGWYRIVEGGGISAGGSGGGPGGGSDAGFIAFVNAATDVSEAAGSVVVVATRTGGSTGAASIDYQTRNGSASAGSDYTEASGTLSWADGESGNQSFEIPIIDDANDESAESFVVALSNPAGASQGSPAENVVTINDNDPPAPNPAEKDNGGGSVGLVFVVSLLASLVTGRRRRRILRVEQSVLRQASPTE